MPHFRARLRLHFRLEHRMVTSLGLLALLTVGSACRTQEALSTEPSQLAVSAGSVTLTYICGNTFRVRNTNATAVVVRWDVYGTTETGALTLPPKPAGASYSETYFTTSNKGTVRLFEGTTLLQTKANGNKPPCAVPSDTSRPPMPAFGYPTDRRFTVDDPGGNGFAYYRTLLGVVFDDSTSGSGIRQTLQRFGATIVGAVPYYNEYVVQINDPGPSFAALDSVRNAFWSVPGVRFVLMIESNSGPEITESRWPNDGPSFARAAWFSEGGAATWALRAIRAPLAWGCETGLYSALTTPRLGVVDYRFDEQHPELRPSVTSVWRLTQPLIPLGADSVVSHTWHGTAVAGVLTATGNNDSSGVGVLWHSNLVLYTLGAATATAESKFSAFSEVVRAIESSDRSVISLSIDLGASTDPAQVRQRNAQAEMLRDALVRLLSRRPDLLLVKSSGNDRTSLTSAALARSTYVLADALVRAKATPSAAAQILLVGGSSPGNSYWPGTTYITGYIDLLAPADSVALLGLSAQPGRAAGQYAADPVFRSGTSFAAPAVAGVAGMLLAMDPSLSGAQLKDLLLRGATQPREDSRGFYSPTPVRGTPDGATVYQLDAYGSLQLLSRERAGTPICGLDVEGRTQPDGSYRVIANRISPEILLEVPSLDAAWTFSVAQGGRRLAVDGFDFAGYKAMPYKLVGGAWQPTAVRAGVSRMLFLEQDTALFSFRDGPGGHYDLWLAIESERTARQVLNWPLTADLLGGVAIWNANANYVSPTGDWVLVNWQATSATCANTWELFRIAVRDGRALTRLANGCNDNGTTYTTTAWRGDGREVVAASSRNGSGAPSMLVRYQTDTWLSDSAARPANYLIQDATWSPEAYRISLTENIGNISCQRTVLSSRDLLSVLESPLLLPMQFCYDPIMQTLPSLRAPGAGEARTRNLTLADWRRGPPRGSSQRVRVN